METDFNGVERCGKQKTNEGRIKIDNGGKQKSRDGKEQLMEIVCSPSPPHE